MNRRDLSSLRCEPQCFGRDAEKACGVARIQPRLDPIIGGLVDANAMMRSQPTIMREAGKLQPPAIRRLVSLQMQSKLSPSLDETRVPSQGAPHQACGKTCRRLENQAGGLGVAVRELPPHDPRETPLGSLWTNCGNYSGGALAATHRSWVLTWATSKRRRPTSQKAD